MKTTHVGKLCLSGALLVCATAGFSAEWSVSTAAELFNAMRSAASGDVIRLAPGEYDVSALYDNNWFHLYAGSKTLTLEGTDTTSWRAADNLETKTVIKGGVTTRVLLGFESGLTLKHLTFKGVNKTNGGEGSVLARNTTGSAVVTNCVFASNRNSYRAAAANGTGITFRDCRFHGNYANYDGAVRYGEFHACDFTSNSAGTQGGAGSSITAYGCSFTGNSAPTGDALVNSSAQGCGFTNNLSKTSNGCGGAILMNAAGPFALEACTFYGNAVDNAERGLGGAVYVGGGELTVKGCTFENCTALGTWNAVGFRSGGAICVTGGSVSISASHFIRCSAPQAPDCGGAIRHKAGSLTLSGCTFTACSADNGGGAVYLDAPAAISGCTFSGNSVTGNGGALVCADAARASLISNCTFTANRASSSAGAVLSATNIVGCTFADNTNRYFSGHCMNCVIRDSTITGDGCLANSALDRCIFNGVRTVENNGLEFAEQQRAAVLAINNSPPDFPARLTNCLFVDCDCFYLLMSWGRALSVVNCTFTGNSLTSYFAFGNRYGETDGAGFTFVNDIISGNCRNGISTAKVGLEVNVVTGVPLSLSADNCLADGIDLPASDVNREVTTSGLVTGTAKFVGPGHPDGVAPYTPRHSDKRIVDCALPLAWTTSDLDLAGNPRVHGSGVDLGCYEMCYTPPGLLIFVR